MSTVTVDLERGRRRASVSGRNVRVAASRRSAGRFLAPSLIASGDLVAFSVAAVVVGSPSVDAIVYGTCLGVVLVMTGAFRTRMNLTAIRETPSRVGSVGLALVLVGLVFVVLQALGDHRGASSEMVSLAAVTALVLPAGRGVSYGAVRLLRRRRIVRDPVLIVGAGEVGRQVVRVLEERAEHGLQPVGFVDDIDPAEAPAPLLGELSSLDRVLVQHSIQRVIVAFGEPRDGDLIRVLRTSLRRSVDVYVVPRLHEIGLDGAQPHGDSVACIPLHRLRPAAPNRRAWQAKRFFDVVVAGSMVVLLSPLLLALAIGVKVSSRGPVLFRQSRVGQYGRVFELLKFRSLRPNHDSEVCWSVAGDDRQTSFGRWMRRFSLDELPQLWNVVRGEMSLIGPRPERPHFVEEFSDRIPDYEDRHRVPVGITGWAQINGLRGDTSIADRAMYDNHYIDDWSLLRDVSILLATVAAVVRDGRSKPSA